MVSLQKILTDTWPFIVVAFLIVLILVFMNMKTERKPMIVGGSCGTVSPNSRCACCSSKPNDAWCKSNLCKSEKFQMRSLGKPMMKAMLASSKSWLQKKRKLTSSNKSSTKRNKITKSRSPRIKVWSQPCLSTCKRTWADRVSYPPRTRSTKWRKIWTLSSASSMMLRWQPLSCRLRWRPGQPTWTR